MAAQRLRPGDHVDLVIEGAEKDHLLPAVVTQAAPSGTTFELACLEPPPRELAAGCRVAVRAAGPGPVGVPRPPLYHGVARSVSSTTPFRVEVGELATGRVERRTLFRVDAAIPVTCSIVEPGSDTEGRKITGVTEDISAGGLRIVTAVPLRERDELSVKLEPSRDAERVLSIPPDAPARVVRVTSLFQQRMTRYRLALRLTFTKEAERDPWVRLVFELQRHSIPHPSRYR